jgi:hypothetical protein
MLKAYSTNVSVEENSAVPFNSVGLLKGTSSQLVGASTIQLNKCGIYEISVSATVTAEAAGEITLQMTRDGVTQISDITETTAADTTSLHSIGFTTLVQVDRNNNINCACSSPVNLTFLNTGVATTYNNIIVTVVRI